MEALYREYEKSLEKQKEIIKSNTEKLRQARESYNIKEIRRLKSLLRVLYEEKSELEERSVQLRNYLGIM